MITHDFPALHHQVCFGKANGRIIWQPRIGCWYGDKIFAGEELPAPFTGMTVPEIYRELDCSARLYEFNSCFKRHEDPRVSSSSRELNETDTEHTTQTPAGKQVAVPRKSLNNPYHISLKWEVESEKHQETAFRCFYFSLSTICSVTRPRVRG